jgi:hypothetical protein
VGIDLICHEGRWLIIEANMKYGRKGFDERPETQGNPANETVGGRIVLRGVR